eukprot:5109642-Amphidinium_carterae.1
MTFRDFLESRQYSCISSAAWSEVAVPRAMAGQTTDAETQGGAKCYTGSGRLQQELGMMFWGSSSPRMMNSNVVVSAKDDSCRAVLRSSCVVPVAPIIYSKKCSRFRQKSVR